jgi:hypothetical protein
LGRSVAAGADSDPEQYSNQHPYRDADQHSECDAHADKYRYRDPDMDADYSGAGEYGNQDADAWLHEYSDPDTDSHSVTHRINNRYADAYTNANPTAATAVRR